MDGTAHAATPRPSRAECGRSAVSATADRGVPHRRAGLHAERSTTGRERLWRLRKPSAVGVDKVYASRGTRRALKGYSAGTQGRARQVDKAPQALSAAPIGGGPADAVVGGYLAQSRLVRSACRGVLQRERGAQRSARNGSAWQRTASKTVLYCTVLTYELGIVLCCMNCTVLCCAVLYCMYFIVL